MALSGFLVPFATGALIERQRISDAYDEKGGEIIDTVSKKLTTQFDSNQKFIENMKRVGIVCGIHYPALHLNPIYTKCNKLDCPKSKKLQDRTVSLPMNEKLSFLEVEYIVDKVKENI